MRRIYSLFICIALSIISSVAQQSQMYVSSDAAFRNARDLYLQQKYAASYPLMQQVVENLTPADVQLTLDAEYYLAANAYELRDVNAIALFEQYLSAHTHTPYVANVNFMLGVLYAERGNMSVAAMHLQRAIEKQLPEKWQAQRTFCLANAYVELERYQNAVTILPALIRKETRYNLSAKYLYGYSQYQLGRYDIAQKEFLAIENSAAYKNIVPYYLIQIYHKNGDTDAVLARAEQLLKNNPKNPNNTEVYRILGEVYYERKDYAQAAKYLLYYEKGSPTVLRNNMYMLGMSFFQLEDYGKAVAYLSQVTTTSDLMTENAYLLLGNAYIKLGDKNNARMAFQNATLTKFDESVHEEAMYNYALTTYETSTALGESVSAFTTFLEQYPNSKYTTRTYELLVNVLLSSKNYKAAYDAIAHLNIKSAQLTDAKEYLLYQLGTESFANNKLPESINYFSQSLAQQGSGKYRAECYFWRAECNYRIHQYTQAIADLNLFFQQSGVSTNANYTMAQYAAGYAHFALKEYKQAQGYFLKYINVETNKKAVTYADALNRVADCYFNDRDFEQAKHYYSLVSQMGAERADYASFQHAYVYGLQKQYDDKISLLEKMVKQYPTSSLQDDALYEIARAHLMKEDSPKAVEAYNRLLTTYPNSNLARKTALEKAMVYYNDKNYEKAIDAYKNVISNYAGSEEAYMALNGMESAYININQVSEYLAYVKSLGNKITFSTANREDSLIYVAAENQYVQSNYKEASLGFEQYVQRFCPAGRYCVMAHYYLANSYYQLDDKPASLQTYKALAEIKGNQFVEEAYTRCAEIAYDLKEYSDAIIYFEQMQLYASTVENTQMARLGILRCANKMNDNDKTIAVATQIIDDEHSSSTLLEEARYNRMQAFMAEQRTELAIGDLEILSDELRTAIGAESKYLLAQIYYDTEEYLMAEAEIMDFAGKNTPQQFWLARSFVLLADIYMKKGEDFQAKQYLLSVQNSYKPQDEIQTLISERLELIAEREKEKIIE